MSRDELAEAMRGADVLVPTVTDAIDAALLSRAGDRLKLIASYGAGVDHVDVATARSRGILVTNTPGVVTDDTADMTMALILAVTRRIPEGLALMQSGEWRGWAPTALLGGRLQGRRLGILGMGRIGQRGAPRGGLRDAGPLPQPPPPAPRNGGGARCHLVGKPRPDDRAHGHRVRERAPHALDLPPDERAAAQAHAAPRGLGEHLARGGRGPERAHSDAARGRDRGGGARRLRARHGREPPPAAASQRRAAAAHGSATREGRVEMGEKVLLTSRRFRTGTARPTWWCRRCCEGRGGMHAPIPRARAAPPGATVPRSPRDRVASGGRSVGWARRRGPAWGTLAPGRHGGGPMRGAGR